MKNKRGKAWIWILIILILIAVGVGVYFWLSSGGSLPGDATNSDERNNLEEIETSGGKFPDRIADFEKRESTFSNVEQECDKIEGEIFCTNTTKFTYISGGLGVSVNFIKIYKG